MTGGCIVGVRLSCRIRHSHDRRAEVRAVTPQPYWTSCVIQRSRHPRGGSAPARVKE